MNITTPQSAGAVAVLERLRPFAVVTGGSSGIGYEIAKQLAMRGYDLAIVANDAGKLRAAASALAQLPEAPHVQPLTVDLATATGAPRLYEALRQLGRDIDVLVANAGVGVTGDFARQTSLQQELRLIQLDVASPVQLIKLVLKDMTLRGEGKVLITSSLAALMPGPYFAVYAAGKAFLRSFGQAIREELDGSGVTVTVLLPGPTDTGFFARAQMLHTKAAQGPKQNPAEVAEIAVDALEEGLDSVVPGMLNKLQAGIGKVMPDKAGAKLQGVQTKPQQHPG